MSDLVFPHPYVIGSDEVGFGCWAGALYVCATIMPTSWNSHTDNGTRVRDSKQMTKEALEEAYRWALAKKVLHFVEIVEPKTIDEVGAKRSLMKAHMTVVQRALDVVTRAGRRASIVADGTLPLPDVLSIPKADDRVPAVSLAACIAKVLRDRAMEEAGKKYPLYGFERHVGYGTKEHERALYDHGPCEIHRMSYGPVKKAAAMRAAPKNSWEIDE